MKWPEGHNTRKFKSKDDFKDENNNITNTKPEKPEGLDQCKPEGSEAQKTRNRKYRREQYKTECTKNRQRRERQKQNKHNFYIHDDSKCRHKNDKTKVGEGATQGRDRRRPLPRLRQKERPQGNWVKREREREQNKPQRNHFIKTSLLGCGLGHLQVVSRESRDGI